MPWRYIATSLGPLGFVSAGLHPVEHEVRCSSMQVIRSRVSARKEEEQSLDDIFDKRTEAAIFHSEPGSPVEANLNCVRDAMIAHKEKANFGPPAGGYESLEKMARSKFFMLMVETAQQLDLEAWIRFCNFVSGIRWG